MSLQADEATFHFFPDCPKERNGYVRTLRPCTVLVSLGTLSRVAAELTSNTISIRVQARSLSRMAFDHPTM
jgi:hypothetical protein